ncbi:hypothetical protein GCM10029976_045050 [Kribbella albertanoniae]|uniref:Uncharacterized protein n=1 Tax=Kribbella albertanoniae TaxID=1266829 RepID=A0A4R4PV33_9ACTN|nr:hypothetical protein [Kribbella albertanoniae]TDC26300.1 hypothetical protein E1261_22830 [Kribbella albertanoniae]
MTATKEQARRWVGVFLAMVAAVVLLGFGYINAGLNTYLPHVTNDQSVRPGQAKDTTWFVLLAVWSLAMLVCAGFPERGRSFWRARGWAVGAVVQGLSGLIAAVGVGMAAALYNIGPADLEENPCRYAGSCWPHDPQLYAWMVPGLIGALAMFVMGCLVLWVPWWIRVLTPVVLWVAAVLTLHAIWVPVLMPIFTGPPR